MSRRVLVGPDPEMDEPPLYAKVQFRVTPEIKEAAQAKAEAKGTTVSEVLRSALERWVAA